MRNVVVEDVPFSAKAQKHYGLALNSMRQIINDQQELGSDLVLSSMLLIDNFEVHRLN